MKSYLGTVTAGDSSQRGKHLRYLTPRGILSWEAWASDAPNRLLTKSLLQLVRRVTIECHPVTSSWTADNDELLTRIIIEFTHVSNPAGNVDLPELFVDFSSANMPARNRVALSSGCHDYLHIECCVLKCPLTSSMTSTPERYPVT